MWLHRNGLTDILFVGFLVSFSSVSTNESSCPTVRASNALHNESNNNNFHFFSSVFPSLLTFHLYPLISFCVTFLTFTCFLLAYLLLSPFMFCSTPLWPSLTFASSPSSSAEFGRWKQVRYWTRWSTTTRQFFIYASLMAWWSPAPRTAPSLSGTWPRRPTSAYAVSSWDTGPL